MNESQPPVRDHPRGSCAHFVAPGVPIYIQQDDPSSDTWHRYTDVSVPCVCPSRDRSAPLESKFTKKKKKSNQRQTTFASINTKTPRMMMNKSCSSFLMLLLVIGIVAGTENYIDYGDESVDRDLENLREFYKILLRRNSVESVPIMGTPFDHLMIRKSQRSPSLRLRFGRSGPVIPSGILSRPESPSSFNDNN